MTNRYSPYYDHDEETIQMSIDNEGDWVHIVAHRGLQAEVERLTAEQAAVATEYAAAFRERDEALAACAAYRAALEWLNGWLESSRENVTEARDGMARVRAILAAPSPGAGWLSPEVASEVRAALESVIRDLESDDMADDDFSPYDAIRAALARLGGGK